MTDLLPPWPLLSAFLAASLVLAITPGPGVLYIVTRSIVQGRRAGLASVAGVAFGNLANACTAALGLAALFVVSSLAFAVVKLAGAAYLIWLGIQMLRFSGDPPTPAALAPASLSRLFRDGVVVSLLNPKTTIFFAAFLPQFMSATTTPLPQSLALGTLFVAVAAATDSIYAVAAGAIAPRLAQAGNLKRFGRRLGGSLFVGLGVFTALAGGRK